MTCPFSLKVYISDKFFAFPYNLVEPQTDVGNKPMENLIVYVPTDDDRLYVDKKMFSTQFKSILVYRHEHDVNLDSRAPRKTASATIVYWNPLVPITEIGAGETRVFSILLTNNLFYCNTMIVHHELPRCPIEFAYPSMEMDNICKIFYNRRKNQNVGGKTISPSPSPSFSPAAVIAKLRPIACEVALSHFKELLEANDFLLCFNLETSMMVKILSLKRIFCIFQYRKQPARYVINLRPDEIDNLYNKLNWERTRRLMKGDIPSACALINRPSLMYIKRAQQLLGIADYSQTIVDFVRTFQKLIFPYQIVPVVLVKLNNFDKTYKKIRLFCKNDSLAITLNGVAPINMPDTNPVVGTFDHSDFSASPKLNQTIQRFCAESNMSSGVTILPMRYNYFL